MAMKSYSPWWLSGVLALGLAIIFAGERAFSHTGMASALGWLGSLIVFGVVAYRGFVLTRTGGTQRKVEFYSVLSHLGIVLALLGYYLTTDSGIALLGMNEEATIERWVMVMRVLWLIAFVVSAIPLVFIEVSMGRERGHSKDTKGGGVDASVDVFQVREMASSGLSIALALSFLMVTCNIADQRNIRKDLSYFKTSSPGTSTVNMVKSLDEPLKVMLFFPEKSEVTIEVRNYFEALDAKTDLIELSEHDRLIEASLAEEHRVAREGTIVFVRGEKTEKFEIPPDIGTARKSALRELDSKVQKSLMGALREPKRACFTVGHGEINDPETAGAFADDQPNPGTRVLKELLKRMNYKVEDIDGYGKPISPKCDVLLVLGPTSEFDEAELKAIDNYLAQGGSAIISMDPDRDFRLGSLRERLGVSFNPAPVADDRFHKISRGGPSDNRLLVTDQFTSHAAISVLSRNAGVQIMLEGPGSFDKTSADEKSSRKVSEIVRSKKNSYREVADGNGKFDFIFNPSTEKRDRYTMMVAIEDPDAVPAEPKEGEEPHDGMRVLLLADAEVLSDSVMRYQVIQAMFVNMILWTGGEEQLGGTTESEKDKKIEHTKAQDKNWFYGTLIGAPLFVLGIGFLVIARRRKRGGKKK